MTTESKRLLYESFSRFLSLEIRSNTHSDEVIESLEVAKQCLDSAFKFNPDAQHPVPDLLSIWDTHLKRSPSSKFRQEPSDEAKMTAETLKNQGNQCMKDSKFEEAIQCYTKSIELSPYNAVYFCNRAAAYSRLEKHHKAIEDCEHALEIDPTYSKAYGRMGIAYSGLGNHAKAVEAYKKALEFDPTNENCKQNLTLAEDRLRQSTVNGSAIGGAAGGFDMGALFNNPTLRNMASQLMSDPNAQNMISNLLQSSFGSSAPAAAGGGGGAGGGVGAATGGIGGGGTTTAQPSDSVPMATGEHDSNIPGGPPTGPDMEPFLRMGHQIAEQLRSQNPELVDQLRQTFHNMPPEGGGGNV